MFILINFLISIIGESFQNVMTTQLNDSYTHKGDLNIEVSMFLKAVRAAEKWLNKHLVAISDDNDEEKDRFSVE